MLPMSAPIGVTPFSSKEYHDFWNKNKKVSEGVPMVRQKPYRRVLIGAIFAFVFVAALACEDLPADLAALATAQPQEVATLQAALTSTVKEAVPTATAQPEPTATPIQRRLTGAAQFTPTPAPDSVEPLVDGPDDTGLVQANSTFPALNPGTLRGAGSP